MMNEKPSSIHHSAFIIHQVGRCLDMAWNPSLSLNPEFVRVLRTTLPRRRALFVAGLTAVLLAAGAWVVWNNSAPSSYGYQDVLGDPAYKSELWARQVKNF